MAINLYKNDYKDAVLNIFKQRPDIFPKNEIDELSQQLNEENTQQHIKYVAFLEDKIVGYCGAFYNNNTARWELDWFAVDKNAQNKGAGKGLLNEVKTWLKQQYVNKVYVQTCSCEGEKNARDFYVKNGFSLISTEKNGYAVEHDKLTYEMYLN